MYYDFRKRTDLSCKYYEVSRNLQWSLSKLLFTVIENGHRNHNSFYVRRPFIKFHLLQNIWLNDLK